MQSSSAKQIILEPLKYPLTLKKIKELVEKQVKYFKQQKWSQYFLEQWHKINEKVINTRLTPFQIQFQRNYQVENGQLIFPLAELIRPNSKPDLQRIIRLIEKVIDVISEIRKSGYFHHRLNLQTIFVKRSLDNRQSILLDIPLFPSLYKQLTTPPISQSIESDMRQLGRVFLQLICNNREFDLGQIDQVQHQRARKTIEQMFSHQINEQDIIKCIDNHKQIYLKLENCIRQLSRPLNERSKKQIEEEAKEDQNNFVRILKINLPLKPKFKINSSNVSNNQQCKLTISGLICTANLELHTSDSMIFSVKYRQPRFEYITSLDITSFEERFSSNFTAMEPLLTYLKTHKQKIALNQTSSQFQLKINQRDMKLLEFNIIYEMISKIPHDKLSFNNSLTYKELVKIKLQPEKPFSSYIRDLVNQPKSDVIDMVAHELYLSHNYLGAASLYRFLIQEQLKKNSSYDKFKGMGNDNDMLDRFGGINIELYLPFDSLFVCEYININLKSSFQWYQERLKQYPSNMAIVYGWLNFIYENDYHLPVQKFGQNKPSPQLLFQTFLQEVKARCITLQSTSNQKQKNIVEVYQLLAGIYYQILGENGKAEELINVIRSKYTKMNLNVECMLYKIKLGNEDILQQQKLFPKMTYCKYYYLQATCYLRKGNYFQAQKKYQSCKQETIYFAPAYHGLLKTLSIEVKKYNEQIAAYPTDQIDIINHIDVFIKRAIVIIDECCQYNPKDFISSYYVGRIYEICMPHSKYYRDNAKEHYQNCLNKNPTFKMAQIHLEYLNSNSSL